MRPRRLVARGFTCFRDQIEIDFTPLDLFAITGPTGAGKTSLLDAMTFALFGRVYRVEGVKSVISLGAKEARVHFEFSVGTAVYRVTRVTFAGARGSQVALDRDLGNGEWVAQAKGAREAEARISEVLGLDFDGFTKAVLLPQNAFGRFLQGDPGERRSILEAVLGIEIYERIQKRANQIAEDRQKTVEILGRQLAHDYEGVTAERLAVLESEAAAAESQLIEARATRDAATECLGLARTLSEARRRANELATRGADLEREWEDVEGQVHRADENIERLTRIVDELDREVISLGYDDSRHLLFKSAEGEAARRAQIVSRLAVLDADAERRAERLETARTELLRLDADAKDARAHLDACEQAVKTAVADERALADRYGTAADIVRIQALAQQWSRDHKELRKIDSEIAELEARRNALDANLAGLRTAASEEAAALAEAIDVQSKCEAHAERLRGTLKHVEELQERMRDVASVVTRADAASVEYRTALESVNHDAAEGRRRADDAEQRVARAEKALARLQMENAAHVLRAGVVVGDPCPVCEREITTQPIAHPPHALTEAEATVKRTQKQRNAAQEVIVTTARALARTESNLATAKAASADGQAKLEQLARELKEALGPELTSVEDLAKRSSEAAREAKVAQHRAVAADKTLTSTRTAIAKIEGELQGLPVVAEKLTRRDTLRHQCDAAADKIERVCGEPPGEKAAGRLDEIANALATAATRTVRARDAVAPIEKAVHNLELERNSLTQQVTADEDAAEAADEEQKVLVAERASKESALTTAGIALEGDVLAAIRAELRRLEAAKISRDRLLTKRGEFTAKLGSLQTDLGTLRGRRLGLEEQRAVVGGDAAKVGQGVDDAEDRLRQAVAARKWPGWNAACAAGTEERWLAGIADTARQAHDKAVARDTALSAEVRNFADRLRLANECRARHAEALREATVAGHLGQLLMANRFRKYLLEQAVETLAADGSAHLRELSGGRYTFYTEEADFVIVDGWNADERRSVKTLSGGEGFLASLALALGLAEGLPLLGPGEHGHQRLESLFIDEGFGMLDPDETLDTVTQALGNLCTDERIVGVVTHLPQLAEQLPAQIRVVKSQAGSHVEVVSE